MSVDRLKGLFARLKERRPFADAGALFFVVLGAGVALVVSGGHEVGEPTATTQVTTTQDATDGTTTTTVTDPDGEKTVTEVESTSSSSDPQTATDTETTAAPGFLERVLGEDAIVLAFALLAAVVLAAAVQRVIMGQYGFKVGVLEVNDLVDTSSEAVKKLEKSVDILKEEKAAKADVATKKSVSSQIKTLQAAIRALTTASKN